VSAAVYIDKWGREWEL